jgi:hypothetical protein
MRFEVHVRFPLDGSGIFDNDFVVWWSVVIAREAVTAAVDVDTSGIATAAFVTRNVCS